MATSEAIAKSCGCYLGFCTAETLLDALTEATMKGDAERVDWLGEAYRRKAVVCQGGWRATPPKEDR